ncbi:hypothetical protein GP475_00885 [Corynebacterium poyangense]|uniref:Uncharacterized protein n=1 Tax=Corynebacterium poyangense TaxID=2684405 RepID=A0A7H0SLC4_9CORY|nr:hypothetical protein [Corynebacterium poyangense]MBZ8177438.1 hypothetical protein [Corynebacterium poyangense]QNQ89349.1 hypothetical protein GP475_00885 [Corynebacterium poyangense]
MIDSIHNLFNAGLDGAGSVFQAIIGGIASLGGALGTSIKGVVDAIFG